MIHRVRNRQTNSLPNLPLRRALVNNGQRLRLEKALTVGDPDLQSSGPKEGREGKKTEIYDSKNQGNEKVSNNGNQSTTMNNREIMEESGNPQQQMKTATTTTTAITTMTMKNQMTTTTT